MSGEAFDIHQPEDPHVAFVQLGPDVIVPPDFGQFLEALENAHTRVMAKRAQKTLPDFMDYLEKDVIGKLRGLIDNGNEKRIACIKALEEYIAAYEAYLADLKVFLDESEKARMAAEVTISTEATKVRDNVKTDFLKDTAYARFGPLQYKPQAEYPKPTAVLKIPASQQPKKLQLKPGSTPNEAATESGWVPVNTADGRHYWRAEYHVKDLANGSAILAEHRPKDGDEYDEEKEGIVQSQAKFQVVSFPKEWFKLRYLPGHVQFRELPDGSERGYLRDRKEMVIIPEVGDKAKDYTAIPEADKDKVFAVFNGAFWQQDNWVSRAPGEERHWAGTKVEGVEVLPADPDMATVAIYEDGTVRIGSYKNLPDKDNIKTLRQNLYPLLEQGKVGLGVERNPYRRFRDDIVGSYLATDKDGNVSYLFANFMPQDVAARLAQELGFTDLMLLDVHSVVHCDIAKPGQNGIGDDPANAYRFVPRPSEEALEAKIADKVRSFQRTIEDAYYHKGDQADHFVVTLEKASKKTS